MAKENLYVKVYKELLKEIEDPSEVRGHRYLIKNNIVGTLHKITTGKYLEERTVSLAKIHRGRVNGRSAELGYIMVEGQRYGFRLNIYGQEECKHCGMGEVCDQFYVSTGMYYSYDGLFVAFALPYYDNKPKCDGVVDTRTFMLWGATQREDSRKSIEGFVDDARLEEGMKAADLVVKAWGRAHIPKVAENIFWEKVRQGEFNPEKKPKITN